MVFSSIIFLFLFLPVVLSGYYLFLFFHRWFGKKPLNWMRISTFFLVIASLTFYAWGELRLMLVMVTTILVDYTSGLVISGGYRRGEIQSLPAHGPRTALQKAGIVCSIFSNLALLAFFKYFHFGLENYNLLMETTRVFQRSMESHFPGHLASRHQFLHIRVDELHDRCLPRGSQSYA